MGLEPERRSRTTLRVKGYDLSIYREWETRVRGPEGNLDRSLTALRDHRRLGISMDRCLPDKSKESKRRSKNGQ